MQKVYVVQSVSTGDFLYLSPETGDIGHTKLITNADYFYDFEEAVKAANMSSDRVLWIRAKTQSGLNRSYTV